MGLIARRGFLIGAAALVAAAAVALAFGSGDASPSAPTDPNPGDQAAPVVAFDGTNYLVVWQDTLGGLTDLAGARVAPTGALVDDGGFTVSRAPGAQSYPSIGFGSGEYLVTWSDLRSGGLSAAFAARVTVGGTVLDPNGIPLTGPGDVRYYPRGVAFDGTNFLPTLWFAYLFSPFYEGIGGIRVTPGGALLQPSIGVITSTSMERDPVVAFGQTHYLTAWSDFRSSGEDVSATRITPDGSVVDPGGFAVAQGPGTQVSPAVTFGGTHFFVTWDFVPSGSGNGDVYGARVDENGQVLDPSGVPIATGPAYQRASAVAFGGTSYFVVWQDGIDPGDIYGARVASDGTVLDPAGIPISTAAGAQEAAN